MRRKTRPPIAALPEGRQIPTPGELDDPCISRNLRRAACHGTLDLSFFCLFLRAGEGSHENGEGQAHEEHSGQVKKRHPATIHNRNSQQSVTHSLVGFTDLPHTASLGGGI
jgi:hypothetical protein